LSSSKYGTFLLHILPRHLRGLAIRKFGFSADQSSSTTFHCRSEFSFYTFHALSYLIDVYRKDVRAERSLRISRSIFRCSRNWVAGPIIRYRRSRGDPQAVLSPDRAPKDSYLCHRLSQKILIANTVALSADQIFSLSPDQLSTASRDRRLCYTLQIYYDFAGYSNMAIGLGLMIGFTFRSTSIIPTLPTP